MRLDCLPLLNMGTTFVIVKKSGKTPHVRDKLKMFLSRPASISKTDCNNLVETQ